MLLLILALFTAGCTSLSTKPNEPSKPNPTVTNKTPIEKTEKEKAPLKPEPQKPQATSNKTPKNEPQTTKQTELKKQTTQKAKIKKKQESKQTKSHTQSTETSKKNSSKKTASLTAFAQKVVDLVNVERHKKGLTTLQASLSISRVAEKKSTDMRDNNYFDHQSPTYGSPFEMLKSQGVKFRTAGENIAAGQHTPQEVVETWMQSKGHRANILNNTYTHLGVGFVKGGSYGTYWTQLFISQ